MDNNMTEILPSVISCAATQKHFASSTEAIAAKIVIIILNIFISCFGLLANTLVIIGYVTSRRLQTMQNTMILILAISDVGVTAFVQPMNVTANIRGLLGKRDCILWDVVFVSALLFQGLSLITILILSLQSYITLAYPYRYQTIITKTRVIGAFFFSCLLVCISVFLVFVHKPFTDIIFLVILCSTVVTVVFTWSWTYKLVSRHQRVIGSTQTPATRQNVSRKKVLRSTITVFAVISSLLACYSFILCFFFFHPLLNPSKLGQNTYSILFSIAVTLIYLNSLLNPSLVFWRCGVFRQAAKNIFSRKH
jgi:hypothetical protein